MDSYVVSLAAGALSTLSPCVLPLLPMVVGGALNEHRFGVFALAGGLTVAFVAAGLILAGIGHGAGLDGRWLRLIAALLLTAVGFLLLSLKLQARVAGLLIPLTGAAHGVIERFGFNGLGGQFALGMLLGVVWSPCVGPTLGAASIMAARQEALGQAVLVMALFGIGAVTPLLALGRLSRAAFGRGQLRLLQLGALGRRALGVALLALGALAFTGLDRILEAILVANAPDWLIDLSTSL
ncbi:MAG: cytochrome c biogenesis protein CcdA [Proteobacteria bacterium]|nr:cytochrome c biogenesis protein CcdA [Pseudomonadota bacterium]